MIHEQRNTSLPAMREKYPEAMILRQVGPGNYLAFDTVSDAFGHPTTDHQPSQKAS